MNDMLRNIVWICLLFVLSACDQGELEPRVLFLRGETAQLFVHNLTTGEEMQLTDAPLGVFAYATNGAQAVTVQERVDGGADLWLIDVAGGEEQLLFACPQQMRCDQVSWSADNRRLIYVQRPVGEGAPRLYWLDSQRGETVPVFSDANVVGYTPSLSADSRYLSFVAYGETVELPAGHTLDDGHDHSLERNTQKVIVYDFETGKQIIVPNRMNNTGSWQPTGDKLIFTDLQFFGERFGIHLLSIDPTTGEVVDISDALLVEDAAPSWSADGTQIVFTRSAASTAMGRQIWIMDASGENQQQLTNNANWHHGQPDWSADGTQLVFQRFDTTQPTQPPQIWLMAVATQAERLIGEGNRPIFLP